MPFGRLAAFLPLRELRALWHDVLVHPTESRVVWRVPLAARVLVFAACCVIQLILVYAITQAPGDPTAWLLVLGLTLLVVFGALFIRRSCVIEDGQLIAKGRFATRRVDLRDLRQASLSLGGSVWIRTHHPLDKRGGDVLLLRMIPFTKFEPRALPTSSSAVG